MSVEHYENFPVASWLCPPHLRPPIRAIYWFARTADDLADEGGLTPAQRREALKNYRQALQACVLGQPHAGPWQRVFADLQHQVQTFELPSSLLFDLLSAFERDIDNPKYEHYEALLAYCRYSAQPIGRLLLHLYKVQDEVALQASDDICTALQLINFWQDLSVDLSRGRCYLPLDVLEAHGSHWQDWGASQGGGDVQARQKAVIQDLVLRAEGLMHRGAKLCRVLPGRARWEMRLVIQGGLAIARKIRAQDFDTLSHRPRLRVWDAPFLLARAIHMAHV